MRISIDSHALNDARFKLLGRALNIGWHEALGRCVPVWTACYDTRDAYIAIDHVDIIAERDGFAAAMIAAGLADAADDGRVRIHGVADRIGFLERQAERGRKGGHARGQANAKQTPSERLAGAQANAQAVTDQPLKPTSGSGSGSGSKSTSRKRDTRTRSAIEQTAIELAEVACSAINTAIGARNLPTTKATAKDCTALARAGHDAATVQRVIAAKVAEWRGNDKMRAYLVPSTLLRPSNFARYLAELDAAPAGNTNGAPKRIRAPLPGGLMLPHDDGADLGGVS